MEGRERRPLYWENILFLVLTHLLGAAAIVYFVRVQCSPWTLSLAALWAFLCQLSISGGYHRLFAHRSYKSAWPFRLFHLAFGAASFQASALKWASDHRTHHASTDTEDDPYNIKRGFWWAHWGWLCYRSPDSTFENAKDLQADRLVGLQDRYYLSTAFLVGILFPTLVAWSWGDPWGGFFAAGWLRLLLQYHATFCINSWAHTFGTRPYSTSTSARDSLIGAMITMGEGYHNYHHTFPNDYRNGHRAWHFDPTKWIIWGLSCLRMTWDLNRVSPHLVDRAIENRKKEAAAA